MTSARAAKSRLREFKDPKRAQNLSWFFKTGKGEYGEGDQFLGIRVPEIRLIAKEFASLDLAEIEALVADKFHEVRFLGLAILTNRFKKSKDKAERENLFDFYLELLERGTVNNWDLIDSTAPYFGAHLVGSKYAMRKLNKLADSGDLWRERAAIVMTFAFIDEYELEPTLILAKKFLGHPHDLIHKAVGWTLRELGKKEIQVLRNFLSENVAAMPRTMLRYSIEKMTKAERRKWLTL